MLGLGGCRSWRRNKREGMEEKWIIIFVSSALEADKSAEKSKEKS